MHLVLFQEICRTVLFSGYRNLIILIYSYALQLPLYTHPDQSEEFFENSIRLNKDLENKLNTAESSAELGKLLQKNEREEEAKSYLDSAVNYYKEIKDEDLVTDLVEKPI